MSLATCPTEVPYEEIQKHSDTFTRWNYSVPSMLDTATGYEEFDDELRRYSSRDFFAAGEEKRKEIINYVADIYERVGIFPIKYFSEKGVYNEILRCAGYKAEFSGNTVDTGASVGTMMCSWMFPNLFKTPSNQEIDKATGIGVSAWDKFYTRESLEKVVSFCYNYNYTEESGILGYPGRNPLSGIRMTGSIPTNFRPMNAKAIYERFAPRGGVIYDYSTGFGGRMLGALTSANEYTYFGTDPNTESIYNSHRLGKAIEAATGRTGSYELHCCGSEEIQVEPNSVDFAFSSPPYFDLEQYGIDGGDFNNDKQCWNRFPELDAWIEGYVRGTIANIYSMLKKRSYYAVNIADFKSSNGQVSYVDRWRKISEEEGFRHYDTVYLGVRARAGSKMLGDADGSVKHENIMIFKKR